MRSCQCGGTTANVEADVARAKKKKVIEIRRGTGEAREHRLMLRDLSDSDVVQASLDGDARAFGELTRRYDQRLLNFVYRTIGDRERGQDLVQETFVRVYRHLHRFEQAKKDLRARLQFKHEKSGSFSFNGRETGLPMADFLAGQSSRFRHGAPGLLGMDMWYIGAYAQDTWRATDRVTVNLGLR